MRKSGLITLFVLFAVIVIIGILLSSALFENLIEEVGSDAIGAKVEIDDFSLSLLGPEVSWQRLQVTDPKNTMRNLLETEQCSFNMEFWPLISGKFVVEDFKLLGLKRNTDRETDGKLDKPKKKRKTSKAKNKSIKTNDKDKSTDQGFSFGNINTDSIIAQIDIRTPAKIDSAQLAMEENYSKWQEKLSSSDPGKDVTRIQKDIASLDVKKIKSLKSFNKALSSLKNVQGSIDSLNKAFKAAQKDFKKDYKSSGNALSDLDDWIAEDYNRAMSMANLPDFSSKNIAKMLFGDQLINQLSEVLGYLSIARQYFNQDNNKEIEPQRYEGRDIYFSSKYARPSFWLQNMAISGNVNKGLSLKGNLTNVTTNPQLIGKPIILDVEGANNSESFGLNVELNYIDSIPQEKVNSFYNGLAIDGTPLSESSLFPSAISKGSADVDLKFNIVGGIFKGKVKVNARNVSYEYGEKKSSGKLGKIIRDVFNQTTDLKISAKIEGRPNNPVIALQSNLDDKISNAFKTTANKEIEQARAKIRKKIDSQVASRKAELEKTIKENQAKIDAQMAKYQSQIDEQTKLLNSKKKDLDKQKKKLGTSLKNLF